MQADTKDNNSVALTDNFLRSTYPNNSATACEHPISIIVIYMSVFSYLE